MRSGVWPQMDEFAKSWKLERNFKSQMSEEVRQHKYAAWTSAVQCLINR